MNELATCESWDGGSLTWDVFRLEGGEREGRGVQALGFRPAERTWFESAESLTRPVWIAVTIDIALVATLGWLRPWCLVNTLTEDRDRGE
jgi:hypothetical protein